MITNMLLNIQDDKDLEKLESVIRENLRSKRLDVSLLKSMAYVNFRQNVLKKQITTKKTIHFSNENFFIQILNLNPLQIFCGHKDVIDDCINEEPRCLYESL